MTIRNFVAGLAMLAATTFTAAAPATAGSEQGDFMVRVLATGVLPDSKVTTSIGVDGEVTDAWTPATTLTYFITPNIAAELLCCVAQHNIELNGLGEVGKTWIFPPTLTLQYHFTGLGAFKPYVGAGVTFIHFFDEKGSGALNGVGLEIEDAWGAALQAGLDVSMGGGWYLNADVKKIFLETDARYTNGITADVDLDPWIVSFGVGYRFNLFNRGHAEPLK